MDSRRYKVLERKQKRSALTLLFASFVLLILLLFFGIPILSRFAGFIADLKSSSSPVIQEDKTPPAPPLFEGPLPLNTDQKELQITGRAEAGSTVKVFHNSEQIFESVVDETSKFTFQLKLQKGANIIIAATTDKSGNTSDTSPKTTIYSDKEPPSLEITSPKNGENFFGEEGKTITLEGSTETGTKVLVADRLAIVASDGKFSINITLTEGENTILVIATDEAQNKTEKELKVAYTP